MIFWILLYFVYAVVQAVWVAAHNNELEFDASITTIIVAAPLYTFLIIIRRLRK